MAVVDWSNLGVSPGSTGLSYFVTHSLASAVRNEHERDLVHLYYETLRNCGVSQYDFDTCWDEYRLWALDIGMLWATIPAEGRAYIGIWDTLTIMDLNPEELVL